MSESENLKIDIRPYEVLSDSDIDKIINGAFQIMSEIGAKFDPHPRAMEILTAAGCEIADDIVKFPTTLVKQCIDATARSFRLWNRPGDGFIELDDRHVVFMAGVTCPNFVDLETGEKRPATGDDIAAISRVADALPNIDGVCLPCKIVDESNVYGQIKEFDVMARNTSKPVSYLCEDEKPLEAAIEMAAAIRGGPDELREKPYFHFMVTPLPLHFAEQHINHIFLCVENGIPLTSLTVTIGGASSPVTVAGSVIHSLATDFACLVLSQLIEKGSYCGCGSVLAFIDPMTGNMGGMPEMDLAEMVKSQALRRLGLPPAGSFAGGSVDAQFSQYSVAVATASMLRTFYSQPGHTWHLGIIDSGMTFSLHALLYCNELVGYLRRLWKGVGVDDETLALEATRPLGPGGDYMAEMHTAKHCRTELWNPKYFRTSYLSGDEGDLLSIIDRDLKEILANPQPEPLPDPIQKKIEEILKKYGVQ